jgi:hypothetical protein
MVKAKKLTPKEKRIIRDRTILEWVLLVVLLLLAYFFLAQSFKWWPYDTISDDLGSAFYTTSGALKDVNKADLGSSDGSNGSGSSNSGSGSTGTGSNSSGMNGSNGSSGSNGSNGGNTTPTPTTPTPSSDSSSLLSFATKVNTGMTKEELNAASNGLDQNCTLVANATSAGKQEVCVYTQGNRSATVTLFNDRVTSASLSNL